MVLFLDISFFFWTLNVGRLFFLRAFVRSFVLFLSFFLRNVLNCCFFSCFIVLTVCIIFLFMTFFVWRIIRFFLIFLNGLFSFLKEDIRLIIFLVKVFWIVGLFSWWFWFLLAEIIFSNFLIIRVSFGLAIIYFFRVAGFSVRSIVFFSFFTTVLICSWAWFRAIDENNFFVLCITKELLRNFVYIFGCLRGSLYMFL